MFYVHVEYPHAVCEDVLLENQAMPCKIYQKSTAFSIRLSINIQELSVMKLFLCSYKQPASLSELLM